MIRMTIKTALLYLCRFLSIVWYPKSWKVREPAVLLYHSFDKTDWKHGVHPDDLKKQITYLHKEYNIVPLQEVVAFAKGKGELPERAVAITVDDGYLDTYTELFPLAKEYNFHFTIFLTTDLSKMEKLGNLERPTWEQLKEMTDSGLVSLEVHGHTHTNFPELQEQNKLQQELEQCRNEIETRTGAAARFVAYPAGRVNPEVVAVVTNEGFEAVFTTKWGFIHEGDDMMLLKRIIVDRNTSWGLFTGRLTKGLHLYRACTS